MAEIGFIVMLPHSLYQMSLRMSALAFASKPARVKSAASSSTRADVPPAGSPRISPLPKPRRTRPGSGQELDRCTTQPITCAIGIAFASVPSGSSAAMRMPACGAFPLSKNHHGTPFIAVTMSVRGPINGAMCAATSGSAVALTATITMSCTPSAAGSCSARAGAAIERPLSSTRKPCRRMASSVAPRATTPTSQPMAASRAPNNPPMAPAP